MLEKIDFVQCKIEFVVVVTAGDMQFGGSSKDFQPVGARFVAVSPLHVVHLHDLQVIVFA